MTLTLKPTNGSRGREKVWHGKMTRNRTVNDSAI